MHIYFLSFTITNNIINYHRCHPELLSAISFHIVNYFKEEYYNGPFACSEGAYIHIGLLPPLNLLCNPSPIYVYMQLCPWIQSIMTPLYWDIKSPPPDYDTHLSLGRAEWGNNRALFYLYFWVIFIIFIVKKFLEFLINLTKNKKCPRGFLGMSSFILTKFHVSSSCGFFLKNSNMFVTKSHFFSFWSLTIHGLKLA